MKALSHPNGTCPHCGSPLQGDGYTVVLHCENAEIPEGMEPDAEAVYCEKVDRITPTLITSLGPNEIFVFGSNTVGHHNGGAALTAYKLFGAEYGVGRGRTGRCYAIATKGMIPAGWLETLPLSTIAMHVRDFLAYADAHPDLRFLVTEIGCGLAGYTPEQIAPMFAGAPGNVSLPARFWAVIGQQP